MYRAMIDLKSTNNAFNNPQNATLDLGEPLKSIKLTDADLQVVLYGNFGLTDIASANLTFPTPGTWYNYFTGEEVVLSGNSRAFRVRANEFLMFTNKKLPFPEGEILQDPILSINPEIPDPSEFKIYPVPATDRLIIRVPETMNSGNFRIIDVTGKVIREDVYLATDKNLQVDIQEFTSGLYIFEISDNRQLMRKRFLKK
jgi:hypothetical protein